MQRFGPCYPVSLHSCKGNQWFGGDTSMPVIASFEFVETLRVAQWTCWSVAAGLAIVALVLASKRRSRRASKCCAIASIVASIPFSLAGVYAVAEGEFLGFALLLLSINLAPLLVAVVALRTISASPIEK
jgi:hypothetical protein